MGRSCPRPKSWSCHGTLDSFLMESRETVMCSLSLTSNTAQCPCLWPSVSENVTGWYCKCPKWRTWCLSLSHAFLTPTLKVSTSLMDGSSVHLSYHGGRSVTALVSQVIVSCLVFTHYIEVCKGLISRLTCKKNILGSYRESMGNIKIGTWFSVSSPQCQIQLQIRDLIPVPAILQASHGHHLRIVTTGTIYDLLSA